MEVEFTPCFFQVFPWSFGHMICVRTLEDVEARVSPGRGASLGLGPEHPKPSAGIAGLLSQLLVVASERPHGLGIPEVLKVGDPFRTPRPRGVWF